MRRVTFPFAKLKLEANQAWLALVCMAADLVRWFQLIEGDYQELKERAGRLESVIFPGLILDVKALLKLDRSQLLTALQQAAR